MRFWDKNPCSKVSLYFKLIKINFHMCRKWLAFIINHILVTIYTILQKDTLRGFEKGLSKPDANNYFLQGAFEIC